ncbi:MAG: hypothetical protein AAF798_02720 [Bacteroidota bacterium]
MNEIDLIDERIIRVTDILEQIQSVDAMIKLHRQKGDAEDFMLVQYRYRRGEFVNELAQSLKALDINPSDFAA